MVLRKCPQLSQQRCCLTRPSQSSVLVSSMVSADRGGWGGGGEYVCLVSSLIKEFDEAHHWLF